MGEWVVRYVSAAAVRDAPEFWPADSERRAAT